MEGIYKANKIQRRIGEELLKAIDVGTGIRQGVFLSRLHFNLIMDEIIMNINRRKGTEWDRVRSTQCLLHKVRMIPKNCSIDSALQQKIFSAYLIKKRN